MDSQWCEIVYDGTDTDGTIWNRCTIHDRLVMDGAYVCEGYEATERDDDATE